MLNQEHGKLVVQPADLVPPMEGTTAQELF